MRTLVGAMVAGMFLVGVAGAASAAESSGPNFTFGASTSYVYDFNDPKSANGPLSGTGGGNFLSYANQEDKDETFNIDLVQIGISGSRGKGSYGAKLDYGDLAVYAGDDKDGNIGLQTAYLSYDMGGASLTAGRFDTPIGYEVLEPWGNANISRSYSWSLLQPINHDGAFASGHVGVLDGMIGVANGPSVHDQNGVIPGSQVTPNDFDDEKAVLGAVGAGLSDALNLYGSMLYSKENDNTELQIYNAIISGKVPVANNNNFRYAIEGNYRMAEQKKGANIDNDSWSAVAYLGGDFGPTSLDVRGEYLTSDINKGNPDQELWSGTVTAGWYMTEGLQFRLEYRYDKSEEGKFYKDNHSFDSDDATLQAQLVWYPEL